ncbi:MAG: SPASM domain-containing protein, partial [bacterium]
VNWAGAFSGHDAKMKRYPCGLLWIYPSINWNGNVSACCVDWMEELIIGDVNKQSIEDVWNGEEIKELRKMHVSGYIPRNHPCYECDGWSFMSRMFNLRI